MNVETVIISRESPLFARLLHLCTSVGAVLIMGAMAVAAAVNFVDGNEYQDASGPLPGGRTMAGSLESGGSNGRPYQSLEQGPWSLVNSPGQPLFTTFYLVDSVEEASAYVNAFGGGPVMAKTDTILVGKTPLEALLLAKDNDGPWEIIDLRGWPLTKSEAAILKP